MTFILATCTAVKAVSRIVCVRTNQESKNIQQKTSKSKLPGPMQNTLLFGNGINNLSAHPISWNHLLNQLKGRHKFSNGTLPNTLIYERALFQNHQGDDIRSSEFSLKDSIATAFKKIESNHYHDSIIGFKFDHYLTSNYDYALENRYLAQGYTSRHNSTEDIYSVRRHNLIENKNGKLVTSIWHLHGEIDRPMSIMLGYDQYCGAVSKIDGYIKGTYEFTERKKQRRIDRIEVKLRQDRFDGRSWTELFFNSNLHILGLSLDFSETDLWWLLNKRARLLADHKTASLVRNNIYFYTPDNITRQHEGTLRSFSVDIVKTTVNNNWSGYYDKAIHKIRTRLS